MSRAVFVDASAWIAITNRRDDYHFVAQELYRELTYRTFEGWGGVL